MTNATVVKVGGALLEKPEAAVEKIIVVIIVIVV